MSLIKVSVKGGERFYCNGKGLVIKLFWLRG
jgi:flagellar biosynthesis regulator FlbT